jgi:FkbM family methyltransferase
MRQIIKSIIAKLLRLFSIDPISIMYFDYGIGKFENDDVSGEKYFLESVLAQKQEKTLTVFDVGANIGDYSKMVLKYLPESTVYSFEPNPNTFKKLKDSSTSNRCFPVNLGLGDTIQESSIYSYENEHDSQHASLYEGVITGIHSSKKAIKIPIFISTLDAFCEEHKIGKIDFLKIDTEGHELSVLKGAVSMLSKGSIDIIQFEFNEMNVISRVFLKDFYDLLENEYEFFRLDTKRLIPLNGYKASNEIFKFQNIVCIHK